MQRKNIFLGILILIIIVSLYFVNFKDGNSDSRDNLQNNTEYPESNYHETKKNNEMEKNSESEKSGETEKNEDFLNYAEKFAFIEGKDGWFYTFTINTNGKHFYNGYNLKYKTMEGYNVLFYQHGKIVDRMPAHPTLAVSEKKKNGVSEREEILKISEYFDEKQFNRKITINDLSDLKLENFEKKQITELYNSAFKLKFDSSLIDGVKAYPGEIRTINLNNETQVIVGILNTRSSIEAVRIDVLYSNGSYLSDLTDSKKTTEQKTLTNNFKKIEQKVIEKQTLKIEEYFNLDEEIYDKIFQIIESFSISSKEINEE